MVIDGGRSDERKNRTDRRTQYFEPGVLRGSGPDKLGRAPHERSLWFFEYYV